MYNIYLYMFMILYACFFMFSVGLLSTVSLLALRDGVCMILRGVTTRTNWPKCHKLRDSVNLQAMARVLVGYQCCKKP